MKKATSKILRMSLALTVGGAALSAGGCQRTTPPAVAKVSPEEARPGATVTIEGKGFSKKPADSITVTVGQAEAQVKRRGADSLLVVELPKDLKPGSYDLVVTDRSARQSSKPVQLSVTNEVLVLPAGTSLKVRATDGVSSGRNQAGDTFRLTLDQPLVINGRTVAPAGSQVVGRVTEAKGAGRVSGRAELGFTLVELKLGQRACPIVTDAFHAQARSTKKRDAATIGGGAGLGAVIGGIAGGKKGAAIGATLGGAAGTGVAVSTRGKEVEVSSGARFTFRLKQPVEMEMTGGQPVASAR
ncbi:IPT/TIG domain-containing protein [bacterium]|nr:IPT/TIG domain-containing protein [bacterium]